MTQILIIIHTNHACDRWSWYLGQTILYLAIVKYDSLKWCHLSEISKQILNFYISRSIQRDYEKYTYQKKPTFTKETRKSSIYRHISLLNDNQPPMAKLNVTSKDGLDRFLSKAKQSDTYIAGILNPAAADS